MIPYAFLFNSLFYTPSYASEFVILYFGPVILLYYLFLVHIDMCI